MPEEEEEGEEVVIFWKQLSGGSRGGERLLIVLKEESREATMEGALMARAKQKRGEMGKKGKQPSDTPIVRISKLKVTNSIYDGRLPKLPK